MPNPNAFLRQRDIIDPSKLEVESVTIVGSGAIGSFTALALAKMGVKTMTLWDTDEVVEHNIANQFFAKDSLGKSKVEAVKLECLRQAPESIDITTKNEMYTGQPLETSIVIALTDNIEGRAAAFKAAQESFAANFFVDGRMGGELLRILSLNPKSLIIAKKYLDQYIDGVQNQQEPCTARTIIYNVLMASSVIANQVKRFVNNEPVPFIFSFNFKDYMMVKSKVT